MSFYIGQHIWLNRSVDDTPVVCCLTRLTQDELRQLFGNHWEDARVIHGAKLVKTYIKLMMDHQDFPIHELPKLGDGFGNVNVEGCAFLDDEGELILLSKTSLDLWQAVGFAGNKLLYFDTPPCRVEPSSMTKTDCEKLFGEGWENLEIVPPELVRKTIIQEMKREG